VPSFSVLPGVKVFLFIFIPRAGLSIINPVLRETKGLLKDQPMLKVRSFALALASLLVACHSRAQFADAVSSYTQGSGVSPGYNTPSSALGAPTVYIGYQNSDPFNPPYQASNIVGVGTGGSLTLHLSNPILNDPTHPYGLDFIIFGHAGFEITNFDNGTTDGSFFTGGTSTSRVSVSADGLTFYTLNPAQAPQVDGLFPTDSSGNPFLPVNPALTQGNFAGKDLAGIRALYAGSGGGMGFDLSMAQDGLGQSVFLPAANYVRVDVLNGAAYIDALSLVPEPGTGALIVAGVALALARRFRRGRKLKPV
jgi:hypothetical protein